MAERDPAAAEREGTATTEPGANGPPAHAEDMPALPQVIEMLRRERADFRNYRRRLEAERAGDRERTRGELVHRLLPVLDELDRAFAHVPPDLAEHPWAEGVALNRHGLQEGLRKIGLERFAIE